MEDEVAARDRFGPAGVPLEVRGGEGEPFETGRPRAFELAADFVAARWIAQGRADLVARGQGLQDAVSADEPGPARDQNQTHIPSSLGGPDINGYYHNATYRPRVAATPRRRPPGARRSAARTG